MAVLGCMEAGRAWGCWRWAVWGGRGFQPNSLPGAQATQQAGSKAPHLWPQGSPNIRSILFRNLLFCYTLMCFYRFPAVTIYCFPNKKFKKPNQRLVLPLLQGCGVCWKFGVRGLQLHFAKGASFNSPAPRGWTFAFHPACPFQACSQRMPRSTGVTKPKVTSLARERYLAHIYHACFSHY